MAGQPPKTGLENVLGVLGASGYMQNLGPGARSISKAARTNYLLGMANAKQRYAQQGNQNNSGRARIHYAAIHGDVKLLRNLKNLGADLEMTLEGETPLILAVRNNQPAIVEELCNLGADLNRPMENGETALHLAVYMSNYKIVNILLNCKADVTVGAGSIMTPLHIAAFNGNEQMIELLLKHGAKATLDAKTMNLIGQQTPLHMAIGSGCLGCVQLLIQAGADVTAENEAEETAIQRAESEYDLWEERVEYDEDNPRVSAGRRAYHRERLDQALEILKFLKDMMNEPAMGGRRKRRSRATRRRKMRRAHKSRKH